MKIIFLSLFLGSLSLHAFEQEERYFAIEKEISLWMAKRQQINRELRETNTVSYHFWWPGDAKRESEALEKRLRLVDLRIQKFQNEFKILKQTTVTAWGLEDGVLVQGASTLANVKVAGPCPNCDGRHYFKSDRAFRAWNKQNTPEARLDYRTSFNARKNRLIRNCSYRIPEGAVKNVFGINKYLCRRPNTYTAIAKNYALQKKNGRLEILMNLHFKFEGEETLREASYQKLENVLTCVRHYFAQQGLYFTPYVFAESKYFGLYKEPSIRLHTSFRNPEAFATTAHWPVSYWMERRLSYEELCLTYSHEIAHYLGLNDSYEDPDCPDSPVHRNDDLMSDSKSVHKSKLYPEAIEQILSPLCALPQV